MSSRQSPSQNSRLRMITIIVIVICKVIVIIIPLPPGVADTDGHDISCVKNVIK